MYLSDENINQSYWWKRNISLIILAMPTFTVETVEQSGV